MLYKLFSTNSYTVWFLYQFIHFLYEIVQRLMWIRIKAMEWTAKNTCLKKWRFPWTNRKIPYSQQGVAGESRLRQHRTKWRRQFPTYPQGDGQFFTHHLLCWGVRSHPKNASSHHHRRRPTTAQNGPYHQSATPASQLGEIQMAPGLCGTIQEVEAVHRQHAKGIHPPL